MAEHFDAFNPPKKTTDPNHLGDERNWPAHVFKWAAWLTDEETGEFITEGRDKRKIQAPNDYLEVKDATEKAAAMKDAAKAAPVLAVEPVDDDASFDDAAVGA